MPLRLLPVKYVGGGEKATEGFHFVSSIDKEGLPITEVKTGPYGKKVSASVPKIIRQLVDDGHNVIVDEDFPTTASSAFLINFCPNEDATVIKLLKKKGYQLLGKTVLDEFACGGTGLYASTGPIFNPHNPKRVVGGSSSGSAIVVAKEIVPFALGHDTGDSVRRPAAYCGLVGFKPTYGLISRYGVIPMASSLDTVGILAKKLSTVQEIFAILAQPDSRDLITCARGKKVVRHTDRKKIAVINELEKHLPPELNKLYDHAQEKLRKLGYSITKINIPPRLRDNLQLTYLILCSTELVNHLNSLQGITYGPPNENGEIAAKRSERLGLVVKERLLMGGYFLSEKGLLEKAQKVRRLVDNWLKKVFRDCDFLMFPSTNGPAPPAADFNHSFAGLISSHWSDNLLLLGNLAGLPSLSLPLGVVDGLPVNVNLDSAYGQDESVLQLATELEVELVNI
ncbi:3937_t:CDS:2 [Gigaspora margarita]|uniref:3937_t:CDS:1 n=1 Tax=Gigaspora margarita TaxID=4874 RepID=A0ABN7VFI6_GIGMA|nr:3937_t:CDS:2 [Gigaspora margarita]